MNKSEEERKLLQTAARIPDNADHEATKVPLGEYVSKINRPLVEGGGFYHDGTSNFQAAISQSVSQSSRNGSWSVLHGGPRIQRVSERSSRHSRPATPRPAAPCHPCSSVSRVGG